MKSIILTDDSAFKVLYSHNFFINNLKFLGQFSTSIYVDLTHSFASIIMGPDDQALRYINTNSILIKLEGYKYACMGN